MKFLNIHGKLSLHESYKSDFPTENKISLGMIFEMDFFDIFKIIHKHTLLSSTTRRQKWLFLKQPQRFFSAEEVK